MESKEKLRSRKERLAGNREYDLLDTWHYLMMNYGWIPFEEFKHLDAGIVAELVFKLNKMNEKTKVSTR